MKEEFSKEKSVENKKRKNENWIDIRTAGRNEGGMKNSGTAKKNSGRNI